MSRRRRIGGSWGNQFGREPLGVYQEKERERTVALVQSSMDESLPSLESLGAQARKAFIDYDREMDPYSRAGLPPLPETKDGGGGFLGAAKSLTGKALHAANVGLQKATIPGQVIAGAVTAPFGEQQIDPVTGQVSREYSPSSILGGLKEVGTDFVTLGLANEQGERIAQEREAREQAGIMNPGGVMGPFRSLIRESEAFNAGNAFPGVKTAVNLGTDPTIWAGPGALSRVAPRIAATRGGRIAGALFETPGKVAVGSIAGAATASQFGEDIPGLNRLPEGVRPFVGGVAGGLAPSALARLRGMSLADLAEGAPSTAVTRVAGPDEVFKHGTLVEFEGLPEARAAAGSGGVLGPGAYTDTEGITSNRYAGNHPSRGVQLEGGRVIPMKPKGVARLLQEDLEVLPEELDAIRNTLARNPDDLAKFDRIIGDVDIAVPGHGLRGQDVRRALELVGDSSDYAQKMLSEAGWDAVEASVFSGEGPMQAWFDPEKSLRSAFELPELPEPVSAKPTVKRVSLFGDVEDTFQTEAELNGWRAQQGELFDRGPTEAQRAKTAAPKGQRSLFDLFSDENVMQPVAPRRARMAGVEGNSIVRMRGDQIGEALGKSPDEIRRYRELDDAIRDVNGRPDPKHPQFELRERVRKAWTQEYIERTGRQPVFVQAPESRAQRYAEIDRRVAEGQVLPGEDTGGEFEGRFDTAGPRGQRIMQLEKIANDPTASPEMRERARQKLVEEQGGELTGRQPGEPGFAGSGESGLAATLAKSYTGPTSPAALAARAGAGFVSAKLEGEDNSEAFERSLLSVLPGTVARAALRNNRGQLDDGILAAVGRAGEDAAPDGPKVSLKSVDLAHSEIKERPDLFQGRDADPGLTYKESRVQSIVQNFDPNRLEPGLVVHDVSSGDYVVIRGHHRLEAMKRVAAEGKLPERADWQFIEADLTNPADVNALKRMARLSNFGTAETNLREKLDTLRVLQEGGDTKEAIQGQMRLSATEFDDLDAINRALPQDLIDRLTEMGKTQQESAAEVAKVALKAGFAEKDVRAAIGRYVLNPERARTRAQVRAVMEAGAAAYKEAKAAGLQMGMFDDDEIETVLRAVDILKEKEQAILLEKRRATTLINALGRYADNPDLADAAKAIRDDAEARIVRLEQEMDDLRSNFNATRQPPVPEESVLDAVETDRTPVQTGPGLFGDEAPPPIVRDGPPLPELPGGLGMGRMKGQQSSGTSGVPGEVRPITDILEDPALPELPVRRGTGEARPITDILEDPAGRPNLPAERYAGTEGPFSEPGFPGRPDAPGGPGEVLRGTGEGSLPDIRYEDFPSELPGASVPPAGRGAAAREFDTGFPEIPEVSVPGRGRAAAQGSIDQLGDFPEIPEVSVPAAGRGASAREFDTGFPEIPEVSVPGRGRGANQGPLGELLAPEGGPRADASIPNEGPYSDPGFALRPDAPGDQTRYRAEIDDAEAQRINEEWASLGAPSPFKGEGVERGGFVNKLLIDWPNKASRAAFTAATSGDFGSAFIQSGYLAWTHPRKWADSIRQSFHAFGSVSAREGSRQFVRDTIEAAAPPQLKDSIFDTVFKYGGSYSKKASDYSSDIGSSALESKKLGPIGAWFRGSRRQFETQTEIMRSTALADIFRAQRRANITKGLGDTLFPDQIKGAVNVSNHLSGATKIGMHPAAGIAFGAPRFLMSQFALLADAFTGGGVSAAYARRELVKSLGMITTATVVANMALSKGKDAFGPGLGGPQDINSWEDMKSVLTSPNFGRVRMGDADVSLFGPLDPLARSFFNEFANIPDILSGDKDATFPGTDITHAIEAKASPLARAILDTVAGENRFTGEQYGDFGDYLSDNMERLMPIFAQNSLEALRGRGSWAGVGAEFTGLKSSPTTPYERAIGILDSIPGEYWVVDAKNNQLRPPNTIYELSQKQREELRKDYPDIDTYLRNRENDPNKPFIDKVRGEYATAQVYWDSQLTSGQTTTDAWRRQFIANQKQLKLLREQSGQEGADFAPTTQRDQDLDAYFAIWDDPEVDDEKTGLNYEAAEQRINALRARIGKERWEALKETLAWDKSPVVTQYLSDMQVYNDFLSSNPKYDGVPVEHTRKIDAVITRVRQMQASNPGLPGKYALYEMQDRGEIDADTVAEARIAIGRKYSPEYEDWRATEEGLRVTSWFRPAVMGDESIDFPADSGGGGAILRAGRNRSSTSTRASSRKRLLSR